MIKCGSNRVCWLTSELSIPMIWRIRFQLADTSLGGMQSGNSVHDTSKRLRHVMVSWAVNCAKLQVMRIWSPSNIATRGNWSHLH